ncbi:MAG: hypothetical protein RL250_222 [Verrucomicrobiota bacterium]
MRLPTPVLLCVSAATALGCENPFGYSYLAETLKPGKHEIEQYVTGRFGKDLGAGYDARYRGFDLRTEIEHGLSATEQIALEFDQTYFDTADREGLRFRGVSVEYIKMLADPDKNAWGRACYLEAGYSQASLHDGHLRDRWTVESKYILQHNFGDNSRWMYVANLGVEALHTQGGEDAFELFVTQGLSCQLSKEWTVGLEALAASEWVEGADFEESGVQLGPVVNYRKGDFSVAFTVLAQLTGAPANKGSLNVSEYSPYEARLRFSWEF